MKNSYKIILLSIFAGISLWIIDAIVDSHIFYEETFWDSLIFDIPAHEIYYRTFLFVSFVLSGTIVSKIMSKKKKLEEQILQAKNDWEDSFDTITDAITIHDKDFNIIRANKAAEKILGLPFSHIINRKKCYELFHGKNSAPPECPSCEVLKTGKPAVCEVFEPYLNKFIEIRAIPRLNRDNGLIGLIHVVRDITKRKEAEEKLAAAMEKLQEEKAKYEESENSYRTLAENIPAIVYRLFLKEKQMQFFNGMFQPMTGYKTEELTSGKICFIEDLIILPDRDYVIDTLTHALSEGKPFEIEYRLRHKEGDIRHFLEVGRPMLETDGQPCCIDGVIFDITERKLIEEELKRYQERLETLVKERTAELSRVNEQLQMEIIERSLSNERESKLLRELKTIFDNFPVGIVYIDNNYKIISANKFFYDFTGFREEDLVGELCYEAAGEYSDDPAKKGREKICSFCKKEECFKARRPTVIERPLKDKFIRVTTIPELDKDGNISRFMEIVEDITERKRAEAEAFRAGHLASLGELAAGVAHEINNPVNGIINLSQILVNESKQGSKENDIANRIIKESNRIATIVSSLLSFARVSKEKKKPAQIHEIMSDSLSLTGAQLQKDGIKLKINIPQDLPVIIAHPEQIEQVFLNILSNARYALNQKYAGARHDKILEILGEKITIDDNHYIRIIFHDRGTGIPSNILDKVLNPFFSTKSGNAGTGLGLSISHGIISDHGGRIMIESTEGEFTKVLIDLPARGET